VKYQHSMNLYCMIVLLNVNSDLLGKIKRNTPLGRPRSRWEDNIKMRLQTVGFGVMDCIELAQDRDILRIFVNPVLKFRVP